MQRNRPIIIGAAILGLLAIGLTLMSLFGRRSTTPVPGTGPDAVPTEAPVIKQLVANSTILPRTVITSAMLRESEVPVAPGAPAAPAMAIDAVIGRLAGDTIRPGQPITPELLVAPIKRTTPANFSIPTGTRAIAVMIDPKSTMGDIIDVGDHVDVVVVHPIKYKTNQQQEGQSRSGRVIAQNLLVLATDPAIVQSKATPPPAPAPVVPGAPAPAPAPPPPPPPPPPAGQAPTKMRVILAALPAEAARIAAAQESGNIHLTMREPAAGDEAAVAEVFEYPIRDRAAPVRTGGNATNNGGNTQAARPATPRTDFAPSNPRPNVQQIITPPPGPWPIATQPPLRPVPTEPPASEVTVIRGTEKTRVLVPQR